MVHPMMFIFSGTERCSDNRCKCICEDSSVNGSCQVIAHMGYNLYRYKYEAGKMIF